MKIVIIKDVVEGLKEGQHKDFPTWLAKDLINRGIAKLFDTLEVTEKKVKQLKKVK